MKDNLGVPMLGFASTSTVSLSPDATAGVFFSIRFERNVLIVANS